MSQSSVTVEIPDHLDGLRLDKALSLLTQEEIALSRARVQALIAQGAVTCDSASVRAQDAKARVGQVYTLHIPPPVSATPTPQDIPLDIVFEDAHLIVVNKPAGLVVHPAPGALDGTLVNALLHHCHDSLSGIGGERRPGIVHRIDKDTSGLLVVAKSDAVHQGLSAQFAAHTVQRQYTAFVWRVPDPADPRLNGFAGLTRTDTTWWRYETHIDRHRTDRTRMCVTKARGRVAITHFCVTETYGGTQAAQLTCRLETGRTHQIRVHLAHLGYSLIGDPTYGRQMKVRQTLANLDVVQGFQRQALHAQTLGFIHPITQESLFFTADLPKDLQALESALQSWNTLAK